MKAVIVDRIIIELDKGTLPPMSIKAHWLGLTELRTDDGELLIVTGLTPQRDGFGAVFSDLLTSMQIGREKPAPGVPTEPERVERSITLIAASPRLGAMMKSLTVKKPAKTADYLVGMIRDALNAMDGEESHDHVGRILHEAIEATSTEPTT